MTKIEMGKEYRTRCGYEVRIYATDGHGEWPVHGAYKEDGKWFSYSWMEDGLGNRSKESDLDLIEVKPRIQLDVWVNVYEGDKLGGPHISKKSADIHAGSYSNHNRRACVKLTIDCEEGEGL